MPETDRRVQEEFAELAPWYVNGTISESDRAWVDAYLRRHPTARAELDWYASLQKHMEADTAQVGPDIGLPRLLHRIRHETPGFAVPLERDPPRRGLTDVRVLLAGWLSRPSYAFGAVTLLVLEAVVISSLFIKHENTKQAFAEFRSIATVPAIAPLLRVSFKPDARESDIRYALLEVGGVLVGGPGQLGEYLVRVPANRLDTAVGVLSNNVAVESAQMSAPGSR